MAGKAALPAPIDRPLSRAYLREFKGWSTAYPPGVSEPTSLRLMENILITRNGAAAVRPGLKAITPATSPELVGTFEPFYLDSGEKAYLVAIRDTGLVRFRVLTYVGGVYTFQTLTAAGFDLIGDWGVDGPVFTNATTYVKYLQIDNKILALSNNGEPAIVFYVGADKKVQFVEKLADPLWATGDPANTSSPLIGLVRYDWYVSDKTGYPSFATNYEDTNHLISSNMADNVYNLAVFYTYSNELGESAPSEIGIRRIARPVGSWLWETPDVPSFGYSALSPSGVATTVGAAASDQLALIVPNVAAAQFTQARDAGAKKLNFYVACWSVQAPAPVEMQLIGSRDLTPASTIAAQGWFVMNPSHQGLNATMPIPTTDNRYNSSEPPRGSQGIVAADRLVIVNDKSAPAVVRWTTNEQGNYLNFAPHRGGGYKTLTSGNMQVPACAKLWQNPQSVDTLTILCMGTDSHSTAYYMAPASVTSQSDNTQIMGFEETTATPGTVSPYGCEVANNALYHPLDDQLMKSTASNYNINHKSMTDQIAPQWQRLANKDKIVSCYFDQRLYYLVQNPDGAELEDACNGNEVWVLDLAADGGSWSRWTTQGVSLRKIELDDRVLLCLVRPDGLFVFDETKLEDDVVLPPAGELGWRIGTQEIAWLLETNTQGANRAHDAWAHLRQVSLTVGNFTGALRFGVRGKDYNGQVVDVNKVYRQDVHALGTGMPFDAEDYLRIARELKEWFFYASSLPDVQGVGQISLVQYRYTPVSVNVGYDFGSVETFEYGRAEAGAATQLTDNGIPQPYLDTARP